ncbi:MAG: ABC transporter permease [Gammaproteobacteria bacterium]
MMNIWRVSVSAGCCWKMVGSRKSARMDNLKLAWRLLKRDWYVGELRILIMALLIAVTSITSIGLFTQRIHLALNDQTGRFLGADLLLSSPRPLDSSISNKASQLQLRQSQGMSFSSVVMANDQFQLAHIKAVDTHYPLRGEIRVSDSRYGEPQALQHGPDAGEVWLSQRILDSLDIDTGASIELGERIFEVSALLVQDPGQTGGFASFAPRLLMNLADVPSIGVIKPGSRVNYLHFFSGPIEWRNEFEIWLKPRLINSQKLLGGREGSPAISSAMERGEQYLSLGSMLSVMLAGIAIAMAANRYSQRHFDQSALLRCMGATQHRLIKIYLFQILLIGLIASSLGVLAGLFTQQGLISLLAGLIPDDLPSANAVPIITGLVSGMVTLLGFSLPAILRLKSVSPLRVLRRDLTPLPLSAWLVYGLALLSLVLLMWWQSNSLKLTLVVLVGVFFSLLMLYILSWLLMTIGSFSIPRFKGPWRTAMQQLLRHRAANQLQLLAFGLAMMILLIITLLRTDLVSRWQAQLPEQAPNHFVVNIQDYQVDSLKQYFQQNQITAEGLYPMVRGRISSINNTPVLEAVSAQGRENEALKRELNLSWANKMQAHNVLLEGDWWQTSNHGEPLISIEQGLARGLGLKIGDKLGFQIADQSLSATISNIRKVRWDSFQPNFYIIFPPGVLDTFPHSFITSFHLASSQKTLINPLLKQLPGISIIEVDAIMKQLKTILTQVTLAVEYVMLFVLLAGLSVLFAALHNSLDERMHNAAIIRTLGASKHYIRISQWAEFSLLGLFAGLLAVSACEIIAYGLYTRVFNLEFELHLWMWFTGPLISAAIISTSGMLASRKVLSQSPLVVLNEL